MTVLIDFESDWIWFAAPLVKLWNIDRRSSRAFFFRLNFNLIFKKNSQFSRTALFCLQKALFYRCFILRRLPNTAKQRLFFRNITPMLGEDRFFDEFSLRFLSTYHSHAAWRSFLPYVFYYFPMVVSIKKWCCGWRFFVEISLPCSVALIFSTIFRQQDTYRF